MVPDGCTYVFLDMGSNIGIQIRFEIESSTELINLNNLRKLFEPQHFPGAPVLGLFDRFFGTFESRDPKEVCAVGWEPNPTHSEHLKGLEAAYNKCGWRLTINTETGVGAHNSVAKVSHKLLQFLTCSNIKILHI